MKEKIELIRFTAGELGLGTPIELSIEHAESILKDFEALSESDSEAQTLPTNDMIMDVAKTRTDNIDEINSFLHGGIYVRNVAERIAKVAATESKDLLDRAKEIASIAWKGAANAYRMYPNNKHTFSDYWEGAKEQFSEFSTLPKEEDAIKFAEYIGSDDCEYFYNEDIKKWYSPFATTNSTFITTTELYSIYKEGGSNG